MYNMFVYGVRCGPADVTALANRGCTVIADYYMEHGILVFPSYTKSTCLMAKSRRQMNSAFWSHMANVAIGVCREMDVLEHPYISDDEATALTIIRETNPEAVSSWYFLPEVVVPALIVSEA